MSVGISVITAVYNAEAVLPGLIASLQAQTDRDFEWIVVDGGSSDRSLHILHEAGALVSRVISEADFGIYDALNKGVRAAAGDYYLVLGADDFLCPDAIANYRAALDDASPDIVTARVRVGARLLMVCTGKAWLYGMRGFVSAHSIGSLIRRDLHERYGYYSNKLPIAADHLFINTVAHAGARIKICDFVAGEFGMGGVSSVDTLGTISEAFRVQLKTGFSKFPQLVLYALRLVNNYFRL